MNSGVRCSLFIPVGLLPCLFDFLHRGIGCHALRWLLFVCSQLSQAFLSLPQQSSMGSSPRTTLNQAESCSEGLVCNSIFCLSHFQELLSQSYSCPLYPIVRSSEDSNQKSCAQRNYHQHRPEMWIVSAQNITLSADIRVVLILSARGDQSSGLPAHGASFSFQAKVSPPSPLDQESCSSPLVQSHQCWTVL